VTVEPLIDDPPGLWRLGAAQLSSRVADCARGDLKALEILYSALAGGIQRRLVRMLRNVAMADDVLQETFVAVWRNAHLFDPKIGIPAAWVWVIARNRAVTALQRQRRECSLDEVDGYHEWPDLGPSPHELTLHGEQAELLKGCMAKLTPAARQCIDLAYFHGLSYAEVSVRLGRPLGSVKTTVRKSLACLRSCLAKELSARSLPRN